MSSSIKEEDSTGVGVAGLRTGETAGEGLGGVLRGGVFDLAGALGTVGEGVCLGVGFLVGVGVEATSG